MKDTREAAAIPIATDDGGSTEPLDRTLGPATPETCRAAGTLQLHLRIPPDIDTALRRLAERRGQTLSGAVTYALREYLCRRLPDAGTERKR